MAVVSDAELRRGRSCLIWRLTLYLSGPVVLPAKVATRATGNRGGRALYRSRRRTVGSQGRREKAVFVKELLFSWFCLMRRSVRSRISPKLMIAKATMLMGEYIKDHVTRGLQADVAVVDYGWLSRWKFQCGVSLRNPTAGFPSRGTSCWRGCTCFGPACLESAA